MTDITEELLDEIQVQIAETFLCQPKEMPWEDRTEQIAQALLPIITRREREAAEAMRERCAGVAEEYPSLEYADIAVVRGVAKVIRSLI